MAPSLLVWLCAAWASPSPQGEVRWTLELAREPALELRVRLDLQGDDDGRTALEVTEGWGGVSPAGEDLKGVEARTTRGEALVVDHPQPWRWEVAHAPGEALRVTYVIAASEGARDLNSRAHYRPLLNARGLHLIGELALLRPEQADEDAKRRVRIGWQGFDEAGWEVVSSFGRGTSDLQLELPLRDVRQGLFLAGEIELVEREVRGGPLTLALFDGEWGFDSERLADLAARVVDLEREFFGEGKRPSYLISLLPVGAGNGNELSLGGTGLENAFATFAPPRMQLAPGAPLEQRFVMLLLHEMFHEWNGRALAMGPPEPELYWFSEGFTSFYARRLAVRGGWSDAAQFARELNEVLRDHALNPARSASAAELAQRFWTDRDAQRMPYLRGDLLACLVDHAIRSGSEGERSLDDLMRELVVEARARPQGRLELTRDFVLERIARWAGADLAARVRAVAVDGSPLELPPDVFAPALALEPCELFTYELGFDLERTQRERAIRGLVPGSSAERAGLQEGERLAGANIWPGDPEHQVELQVGPQGSERRVVFLPQGPAIAGQRAVVKDAANVRGVL
jgi:predicted metalloprotease with PDZ domain